MSKSSCRAVVIFLLAYFCICFLELLAQSPVGHGLTVDTNSVVTATNPFISFPQDVRRATAGSDSNSLVRNAEFAGSTQRVAALEGRTNQWNAAPTNATGNVPWQTWSFAGAVWSLNTNSTKIAIAPYTDNNLGSGTNANATTLFSSGLIPFIYEPIGSLTNAIGNTPWQTISYSSGVWSFNTNSTKIATATYTDNNLGSGTNANATTLFSSGLIPFIYEPIGSLTNATGNVPWQTWSYASGVWSLNTNATKIATATYTDNNLGSGTNANATTLFSAGLIPFLYEPIGSLTNAIGNTPWQTISYSSGVWSFNTNSTKIATATYTDNNLSGGTNANATTLFSSGLIPFIYEPIGSLTNAIGNVPWETISYSSGVWSFNTNATKIALVTYTDNNGASFTNIPYAAMSVPYVTNGWSGTLTLTGTNVSMKQSLILRNSAASAAGGAALTLQDNNGNNCWQISNGGASGNSPFMYFWNPLVDPNVLEIRFQPYVGISGYYLSRPGIQNFGFGTNAPDSQLHVNGNIHTEGTNWASAYKFGSSVGWTGVITNNGWGSTNYTGVLYGGITNNLRIP